MAAVTNAAVEVVDLDLDDDDLMDEDAGPDPAPAPTAAPRLRSTIAGNDAPRSTKARDFRVGAGGHADLDALPRSPRLDRAERQPPVIHPPLPSPPSPVTRVPPAPPAAPSPPRPHKPAPGDGVFPSGGAASGGTHPPRGATPGGGAAPPGGSAPDDGVVPPGSAASGGIDPPGGATPGAGAASPGGSTPRDDAIPPGGAASGDGAVPTRDAGPQQRHPRDTGPEQLHHRGAGEVGTLTWDTLESLCHRLFPAELDEHCRPDLFHNHDEQACATEKIVPAVDTLVHLSHLDASTDVLISSFYQATLAGFWSRGFSRDAREQPLRRSVPIAQEERSVLAEVDSNRSRSGRPPEPPECQRATRSQSTVTLQTMARRAGALPGDAGVPASLKAEDRTGQILVLGTGKKKMEKLTPLEVKYPNNARGIAKFNVPLALMLFAWADFIIVSSRFEPCGLIQLQGMRYGVIPICSSTGGLVDTVTGFHMGSFNAECETVDPADVTAVASTITRALQQYDTPAFHEMVQNCMAQDLSWKGTAKKWEEVSGGFDAPSPKTQGHVLPWSKMTNADLGTLSNSDEAQAGVQPLNKAVKRREKLGPLLRNMVVVLRPDPIALARALKTFIICYFVSSSGPTVILLTGLQGVGQTIVCAKLAFYLKQLGTSCMLVGADVYRPAAIDQLTLLGQQVGVPVCSEGAEAKPTQITKNAMEGAQNKHIVAIVVATAGKLQIDKSMMDELKEVKKAAQEAIAGMGDLMVQPGHILQQPELARRAILQRALWHVLPSWACPPDNAAWEPGDTFRMAYPPLQLEDELLVEGGRSVMVSKRVRG